MWPRKFPVLGVRISATTYDELQRDIFKAVDDRVSAVVSHLPVHGLVLASRPGAMRAAIEACDVVAPDGQPVRWALNCLHGTNLGDRVYGPELMLRLCRQAADTGLGIYLYGSTTLVLNDLKKRLLERMPTLRIVGAESPPFRALTPTEDLQVISRINDSGASLVFLGLGCPKQEIFAAGHRETIHAVQLCVGAAFDFHAGNKKTAPPWMQRSGLEWLFRFVQEPGRLWRRYLVTNSIFLWQVSGAILKTCLLRL